MSGGRNGDRAVQEAAKETMYREADEIKIKTSESKEVRPMKEGGSSEDKGVKKVNRLEIPKGVSDRVEERERQMS